MPFLLLQWISNVYFCTGENIHTYVKPSEYMDKLSAHSLIRITAMANVQETEQLWSQDDDFIVQKPQLAVSVSTKNQENKHKALEKRLKYQELI